MLKFLLAFLLIAIYGLRGATIIVAESGGTYTTIQAALNAAQPGDSILVKEKATPYYEKINFVRSGNAEAGYITLMAYPGQHPVIDGSGVPNNPASYTDDLVYMENISYVRLIGFEIRNVNTTEGSGIRVYGSGSYIELRDNEIHEIRGGGESGGAMGITVYGADDDHSINHLIIDGNHIHDCDPAWSEALTLNGNVEQFEVTNNIVEDVNNIGIDFIGGEDWLSSKFARNGRCAWNRVYRARSSYEDGYAAGIYVDGGQDITIENNIVSECDLGIEIGAENAGVVTEGIKVRNNIVYKNDKAGLVFGGYDVSTGRVKNCSFTGNTCFGNDVLSTGHGELWIQYAEDNDIRNNILYGSAQNLLLYSEAGNVNNTLDYNLWYVTAGAQAARWVWNGTLYTGFADYRAATGQDAHSLFDNPSFVDAAAADFHLNPNSPAVDAGDPNYAVQDSEQDMDGDARLNGNAVDIGADENGSTSAAQHRPKIPDSADLLEAYPNPFSQGAAGRNGQALTVRFQLSERVQALRLTVYDVLGRKIRTLFAGSAARGEHALKWDGLDAARRQCPPGVYLLVLRQGAQRRFFKLILLK